MNGRVRHALVFAFAIAAATVAGANQSDVRGHHAAAGLRVWFRDSTAFVLEARVELARAEQVAVAFRPALLFAENIESRSSVSVDLRLADWLRAYVGGGVSWNESGSGALEPFAAVGIDAFVGGLIVLNCHLNSLFRQDDIDTELFVLIGVRRLQSSRHRLRILG